MGSEIKWLVIWVILYALFWPNVQGSQIYPSDSLNSFFHDYAVNNTPKPHTGKLYNVSLPVSYSGIEVSIVRLRSRSLWLNGANFSSFDIPPRVLPRPFTKRVDLVYQNLGNWSRIYYNVPNYTFVAPVIGFQAYDSNKSSTSYRAVELNIMGNNPIIIRFPNLLLQEDRNVTVKCVRIDVDGTLELSNVTAENSCLSRRQGHFSIVIPSQINKKKEKGLKWWAMGLAAGLVGVVLLIVLGIVAFKYVEDQRIRKMERQSERSERLDTIWIGRSRMPSASRIRTQPILENSYVP